MLEMAVRCRRRGGVQDDAASTVSQDHAIIVREHEWPSGWRRPAFDRHERRCSLAGSAVTADTVIVALLPACPRHMHHFLLFVSSIAWERPWPLISRSEGRVAQDGGVCAPVWRGMARPAGRLLRVVLALPFLS
jgi:hypothetical protein